MLGFEVSIYKIFKCVPVHVFQSCTNIEWPSPCRLDPYKHAGRVKHRMVRVDTWLLFCLF